MRKEYSFLKFSSHALINYLINFWKALYFVILVLRDKSSHTLIVVMYTYRNFLKVRPLISYISRFTCLQSQVTKAPYVQAPSPTADRRPAYCTNQLVDRDIFLILFSNMGVN
jgi:hypothetical protein